MAEVITLRSGALHAELRDGDLRALRLGHVEVLRGLTVPLRDADWGTLQVRTTEESHGADWYRRAFTTLDGTMSGRISLQLVEECELLAEFALEVHRATRVNRTGFTLLHPIAGVAGSPLELTHADGSHETTRFPDTIMASQPAMDIRAMRHRLGGVQIEITFEGEIFEMEDQRNWSDASFKTYCRPLSLPRPYALAPGDLVHQQIRMRLTSGADDSPGTAAAAAAARPGRLPQLLLAHDAGQPLDSRHALPLLLRLTPETPAAALAAHAGAEIGGIEIVFDSLAGLEAQLRMLGASGLAVPRLMALPRPWLQSHQPQGPWPDGPRPEDALPLLRAAFPKALIGTGSLTHFTEANRWPLDPRADFVGFGNAAIVHAADDLSVAQTLEALPQILASARALGGGKPLHLGLIAIAMRSNPYGAGLKPNPDAIRMTMTDDDPRQGRAFAAAYAGAVMVLAAEAGVESLALSMGHGPLSAPPGSPLDAFLGHLARLGRAVGTIRISRDSAEIQLGADGWRITRDQDGQLSLACHQEI